MKKIARTKIFMATVNAALPILLILAFQSIGLGQVYSYTDASASEYAVYGYGAVTGTYNSSTHVYQTTTIITSPSGRSATASSSGSSVTSSLSIEGEGGNFSLNTYHEGTCPYQGQSHTIGGSGASFVVPTACALCQAERSLKRLGCYGIATACELGALANYNNAITQCENNTFCQENNPNYNPEECDRCKDGAQVTLGLVTAGCGAALAFCLNTILPDCTGKDTGGQGDCENN